MNPTYLCAATLALLTTAACATVPPEIAGSASPLELRQMQSREYGSLDKSMTLRSVVASLQDLGFTIDAADADLGTVSATRLDGIAMRMTVTVVDKAPERIVVRASARLDERFVDDPLTYQDFFVVLDKAMFLTRRGVD